jgi:transcriptional regulator with XRE-family HTH domain
MAAAPATLSERLRALRKARGESQQVVASRLGLTKAAVSLWERNKSEPSSENIERLVEHYGLTSRDWLMDGTGEPPAILLESPASDQKAPHVARLEAIMDVLGYGKLGGQKRFAEEIGVKPTNFNHVMKGSRVSTTIAFAIKKRFRISLDFLWCGDLEALRHGLEQQLRDWERRKGKRIFAP